MKKNTACSLLSRPFLFLHFLVNGVALHVNTNSAYLKGAKGYLVALGMNIGGLVGWPVIPYASLFAAGTAAFVTQALNPIVLVGLTVNLGIATVITKKCLDETNNVYTGAFPTTIVITVMTIASSTMYGSLVKETGRGPETTQRPRGSAPRGRFLRAASRYAG